MRPRVKYQIIYMNRNQYPVLVMCHFFGVSRSGYYDYVKRLDQPARDAALADIIREQQKKCDKTYGYRRMWKWLGKVKKIHRNPKTILRIIMSVSNATMELLMAPSFFLCSVPY